MFKIVSDKPPKKNSKLNQVLHRFQNIFTRKNGTVCLDSDNFKTYIDKKTFDIITNAQAYSNYIGQLQIQRSNKIKAFVDTLKDDYLWHGEYAFVVSGSLVNNRICITSDIDYFFILQRRIDSDIIQIIEEQLPELFAKDCPVNNLISSSAFHKAHFIHVKDLPKYYKENELFRNSLSTGLIFPSKQKFGNEINSTSNGLWDELRSNNTIEKLLEKSLNKVIEQTPNLYSSKKLPAMIKPLIIAKMLLNFQLTDDENQKTRQIQDMLFRIRDCAYFENNQQHINFTNKSFPHYERVLRIDDLQTKIVEARAYILSLLKKYHVI